MEPSFITTRDQAQRLSELHRPVSIQFKRERFDALGLGLGLGDCREANIDLGSGERLWRLVRVDQDPTAPDVIETTWIRATATNAMLWAEDDPRSAFPAGEPHIE